MIRSHLQPIFTSLVVLAGIGLGIMYVMSPYKVKRWVGIASSYSEVFVAIDNRILAIVFLHQVSKHLYAILQLLSYGISKRW